MRLIGLRSRKAISTAASTSRCSMVCATPRPNGHDAATLPGRRHVLAYHVFRQDDCTRLDPLAAVCDEQGSRASTIEEMQACRAHLSKPFNIIGRGACLTRS